MRKILLAGVLCCAYSMFGQSPTTPNIHLNIPYLNTPGWNVLLNDNFSSIDLLLSGNQGTSSLLFTLQASTTTPTAGHVRLYMNADGFLHVRDANGNDYALGSGGGGGTSAIWGQITGTLSNQGDLQSALNAKQVSGNYIVGLTGDVTATGPGTVAATLATVNSNVGACGDATHVGQATFDAKGRATACTAVAITTGGAGTVTSFAAPSGVWPSWLVPNVANSTTTPSLSVTAGNIPNSALTNSAVTVNGVTCTLGSGCTISAGTPFYQTFQANGTPSSQQATFNAVAGTNMTITPTTVGAVTTFTFASSGGGGGGISTGTLASLPTTCVVATAPLYYVTDQPAGQQIYTCDSTGHYIQTLNLGGSGCLAFTGGSLDIVTSCVPQKAAANTFTANQTEGLGAKWSSTHGTVTQTSGWAALSGGTSGAIATSSIAALGTPGAAGDWVDIQNFNCTGLPQYSVVVGVSITITDPISESCSVHWEIRHDQ